MRKERESTAQTPLSMIHLCDKAMDEGEFVSLHDGGDRTIIVGEKEDRQRLYNVSSFAMSMASPVWKAMFNPTSGFRESNPDLPVEFPEDDPDVLLLLLRIAHLQFQHLPASLSFERLTGLAVLCDKYDTVGLVQPFIEKWASPWALLCLEQGYEDWLLIAWTFGCHQIFGHLTTSLVFDAQVDCDGNILDSGNWGRFDHMPPGIFEVILKAREETITKLVDLIQETTEKLLNSQLCNSQLGNRKISIRQICNGRLQTTCNLLMLALLVKVLHPLGLGPQRPKVSEIKISLSSITQQLKTFNFALPEPIYNANEDRIKWCNLGARLEPQIREILEQVPSTIQEQHKRHLEAQAKKSGIGELKVSNPKSDCILM